jgi:hypothetical protein
LPTHRKICRVKLLHFRLLEVMQVDALAPIPLCQQDAVIRIPTGEECHWRRNSEDRVTHRLEFLQWLVNTVFSWCRVWAAEERRLHWYRWAWHRFIWSVHFGVK